MYQEALEIEQTRWDGIRKLEDRNLQMIQVKEERRVKNKIKLKERYENFVTPLERATLIIMG